MNRTLVYLLIFGLAAVAAVLGYQVYQDRQPDTGIKIDIGKSGVSIQSQ
jgi:hypothetical protein